MKRKKPRQTHRLTAELKHHWATAIACYTLKLLRISTGTILKHLGQQWAATRLGADDLITYNKINNHTHHIVHPATARHIGSASST